MKLKKRRPLSLLKKIIEEQKKTGKKIVLANGCFDLIHVGHIRYLKEAKNRGEILVVALNSDASVRKLKGKGRPILNLKERAEIISSFSFVDYVTTFSGQKVDQVLLSLQPDIHAKGSDYTKETIPEKETVKGYGGDVAIVGGRKVNSTSKIIKNIASKRKRAKA